jgi:hypothetical protein
LIAIGLPQEAAARIFLIAFPRVALLSELFGRNMNLYRLPRRVASRIIEAMTGAQRIEGPRLARAIANSPASAAAQAQTAARGASAPQRDLRKNGAA